MIYVIDNNQMNCVDFGKSKSHCKDIFEKVGEIRLQTGYQNEVSLLIILAVMLLLCKKDVHIRNSYLSM